jgi:thioesterase domain-containing protein
MRKTSSLKIVAYVRMASSSVRKRRSARTDFPSVQGFATIARYARQPRLICTDTHHPHKLNAVCWVNRTRGHEEANVSGTHFQMWKTVYPKIVDCARMASSSVRKRRSARTDFPSVQVSPTPTRYARQPRPICTDTHHPHKLNAVCWVNRTRGHEEANVSGTHFQMWKTVYPKIVDCARMASSSVRKRRSARTDFPSVQALPINSPQSYL